MSKALLGVWFLVAIIYGAFGHTALSNFLGTVADAQKTSKQKYQYERYKRHSNKGVYYVADSPLDEKTKTFPLGQKFPDMVVGCVTPEAAHALALALSKEAEETSLVYSAHGCFSGPMQVTYLKRNAQFKSIDGAWNVFEAVIGKMTVYIVTDWNAKGVDT